MGVHFTEQGNISRSLFKKACIEWVMVKDLSIFKFTSIFQSVLGRNGINLVKLFQIRATLDLISAMNYGHFALSYLWYRTYVGTDMVADPIPYGSVLI